MVLGRLGRVIRQQSDDEVTHSQVSLLFNIRRMQPVTAGDVAVAEGVTPPSITRSLTRLAERGFVVRKAHPGDGRAMLVSLTRKGEEECNRVLRIRDVWLHERLMDLNQEEIDHLLETLPLLERLCDPALSLSSQ
jgi:DNA-binding MarR family transcriptional regulator